MVTGKAGKSGFGSASTAEDVTQSIDANHLTAIITGSFFLFLISSYIFLQIVKAIMRNRMNYQLSYVFLVSWKTVCQKDNANNKN